MTLSGGKNLKIKFMCGIYLTNRSFQQEVIQSKLKEIDFRGPDNLSVEKINNVFLGHLRLSVLDLDKRSNQPFRYKNLCITYNGEIYNFKVSSLVFFN